MALTEKVQMK